MFLVRGCRTITLPIGTICEGFRFIEQIKISELNVIGMKFIHEETCMPYYHYSSPEDTNNVFCIGFNTPNPNSKGLPHVLEHTTLCGGKKFPVRDPFFHMLKRSLNTFMNAMTGPSYTIYPFSTVNEKDFSNLLTVYLDAVFHPLLNKRDFMQEGHRYEFEKAPNSDSTEEPANLTIKGIVYNEMKGALENPASFFYSKLCEHALSGTSYEHVLGGCPTCIPDLTHEELVQFHANHYQPTNAVVVTYGDMDFTQHLKILNEVLQNKKKHVRHSIPQLSEEYTKITKGVIFDNGPVDGMGEAEKSSRTILSWILPSAYFTPVNQENAKNEIRFKYLELEILSALLTNGPASPMYKALIDSHMGTDFTPLNGFESEFRNPLFSFGLQGVNLEQHSEKEIQESIRGALEKAYRDGFALDLVDGVVHQLRLDKSHRKSKFGLNLAYMSVLYDLEHESVFPFVQTAEALKEIHRRHKENIHYFSPIIKQLLLDVEPRVTLVLLADKNHAEKRKALEQKRIEDKEATLNGEEAKEIRRLAKELADAQNHVPEVSVLPTLKRSDIAKEIIPEVRGTIHRVGAHNTCEIIPASCNQLIYTRVLIPLTIANFTAEEILLLPTYATLLCNIGAGDLDYEALTTKEERLCSGFIAMMHTVPYPKLDRMLSGLFVQFHALPERYEEALALLKTIFLQVRFDPEDSKVATRVQSLLMSSATNLIQSIPHNGHRYAMTAAAARLSPVCALANTMEGLEQIVFMRDVLKDLNAEDASKAQTRVADVVSKMQIIHKKVFSHAIEMWSVCEPEEQERVQKLNTTQFLNFVSAENAPQAENIFSGEKLKQTVATESSFVSIATPGEVSYLAAAALTRTNYEEKESAAQTVALKILSNEYLHREIREKGGAYGSGGTTRPSGQLCGVFAMYSYRDPTPIKSYKTMCEGISTYLCDTKNYESRIIDEALLSMFGQMDAPRTPSSYGSYWYLQRLEDAQRQRSRDNLLSTTQEDIQRTAKALAEQMKNTTVCVCLGTTGEEKVATEQDAAEIKWVAKEF